MISADTRQGVKDAIDYDASVNLNRSEEIDLHRDYGRIGYWDNEISNERTESYE